MKKVTVIALALAAAVAAGWFGFESMRWQTVMLPGNIGTVSLPADFHWEMENDTTLLAYPPGSEVINLRFSSGSYAAGKPPGNLGAQHVRLRAAGKQLPVQEYGGKTVISFEEDVVQEGAPLTVRYWEVGARNTVVIISATVLHASQSDPRVRKTLARMPRIIRSIRLAKSK